MKISDDLIAAYLEGKTNKQETLLVLNAIKNDPEVREAIRVIRKVDAELGENSVFDNKETRQARIINMWEDVIPMMRRAANDNENTCSIVCEAYILEHRGVTFDSKELVDIARKNNWLRVDGTPLHAIGLSLVNNGLLITRKYDSTLDDISRFLNMNNDIIVAINANKLYNENRDTARGTNHAIVVTSINDDEGSVTIFDPTSDSPADVPMENFCRAWNDSRNYLVRVFDNPLEYEPEPIHLDDVTIDDELIDLREAIAENLHDVWSINRINEGWTYGNKRDDDKKKHPDLIPYCALTDSEKEYDRQMAWNTLKLVKKLGFAIEKK